MAKGRKIIVTPESQLRGRFIEGVLEEIVSPGNLLQFKAATEPDGTGRYTFEEFDGAADGERSVTIVALENKLAGKTASDAYAAGDRVFAYIPAIGDELNVMVQASSGAVAIGTKYIKDDGTGTLIITTGTPESEPFIALETASDPASDSLMHMMFTGN